MGKQEKSTRKLKSKAPDPSSRFDKIVLLGEDLALAGLFFGLALAFSTQVQVHFTLPKLVVLRVGTLLLLVLGLIRIKRGWSIRCLELCFGLPWPWPAGGFYPPSSPCTPIRP